MINIILELNILNVLNQSGIKEIVLHLTLLLQFLLWLTDIAKSIKNKLTYLLNNYYLVIKTFLLAVKEDMLQDLLTMLRDTVL
jgi:hypothetical protein